MISTFDSLNTIYFGNCYIILNKNNLKFYKNQIFLPENFSYNSKTNKIYLNISQLSEIVKNFIKNNILTK
jgi:hypothetical protein